MKCRHNTLIFLSGTAWLVIGIFLLSLGIDFILQTVRDPSLVKIPGKFSLAGLFGHHISDRNQVSALLIIFGLFLGYFKGKMALAKSVARQIKRIRELPNPSSLRHLYGKGYYLLVALMIGLGIGMKFLPMTLDTRGTIDVIVGSALVNGSLLFFRTLTKEAYKRTQELQGSNLSKKRNSSK